MNYPYRPNFHERPPEPFIIQRREVARVRIESEEKVDLSLLVSATADGERWYFETITDNDCDEHYLVRYVEWNVDNPRYHPLMAIYNKDLEAHNGRMIDFNLQLAAWNKEQAKKTEVEERALYEKLTAKYGK